MTKNLIKSIKSLFVQSKLRNISKLPTIGRFMALIL